MINERSIKKGREFYLDNLKVVLACVVIILHVSLPFVQWVAWPRSLFNPYDHIPSLWVYILFSQSFSMSLFFFISGYFIPMKLEKDGEVLFLKNKLKRLGIPLLVITFSQTIVFKFLAVGHLWFVEFLLLMTCVATLFYKKMWPLLKLDRIQLSFGFYVVIILALSIVTIFVRRYFQYAAFRYTFGFIFGEPAHFPFYILAFPLGIIFGKNQWLEKISLRVGWLMIAVSVPVFVFFLCYIGDSYHSYWSGKSYALVESFFCISFCAGIIVLFREYCNWNNRFWRWASKQSYGVYIFHIYILISFQYLFNNIDMNVYLKYLSTLLLTTVFSFLFTALVRKIPGVSKVI